MRRDQRRGVGFVGVLRVEGVVREQESALLWCGRSAAFFHPLGLYRERERTDISPLPLVFLFSLLLSVLSLFVSPLYPFTLFLILSSSSSYLSLFFFPSASSSYLCWIELGGPSSVLIHKVEEHIRVSARVHSNETQMGILKTEELIIHINKVFL